MIIGFDVDGILADFNPAYIDLCIKLSGKDLFPPRPFAIPTWNYPEHYGYSNELVKSVWKYIKESSDFWRMLNPYQGAPKVIRELNDMDFDGFDVYFMTQRVGENVKYQTEQWIDLCGFLHPTVLISAEKGECCHALKVDYYIDDKNENCLDVLTKSPLTKCYMLARPWNEKLPLIPRLDNLDQFMEIIKHG